jgi:hypothetical protein
VVIPEVFPPFNLLLGGIPAGIAGPTSGGAGGGSGSGDGSGGGDSAGLFGFGTSGGLQFVGPNGMGNSELPVPNGQHPTVPDQGLQGAFFGVDLSATGIFPGKGSSSAGGAVTGNLETGVKRVPLLFTSSSGFTQISLFTPSFPPFSTGSSSSSDSGSGSPSHPGPSPNSDVVPPTTLIAGPPMPFYPPDNPKPNPPVVTPEPTTIFMILPGLAAFAAYRVRRSKP